MTPQINFVRMRLRHLSIPEIVCRFRQMIASLYLKWSSEMGFKLSGPFKIDKGQIEKLIVNQAATDKLQLEFPRLRIAGRSDGYVPQSQMAELVRHINESGADILFLALGSPRQER